VAAIKKNLYVESGATYNIGFVYHAPTLDAEGDVVLDADGNPVPGEPVPLTGCSARMQVRAKVDDDTALITATTAPASEGSEGAGRIALESVDVDGNPIIGRVDIELTDEDTMKLQGLRKAVYDLELIWPLIAGELRPRVDRLLQGSIVVDWNVTRLETTTAMATAPAVTNG